MAEQADGPINESVSAQPAIRRVPVRYGRMRHVGEFACPEALGLSCGVSLVIATDRGIEVGKYLNGGCGGAVSCQQMHAYAENSGGEAYRLNNGRVLRVANEADLLELRHIEEGIRQKIDTCNRFADEFGLDMRIVDCEHLFGGERVVFYFLAAERVDFRELVRRLASEYQTRIEMRQIGARDEARLLADYETCGRECCCRSLLKSLKPVSMQMAKQQKATLDPSKVSGRCGRLKCCLRYEHETYESLVKRLPRLGSWIATQEVVGRVIERQILTQLVRIVDEGGRMSVVSVEEIVERNVAPGTQPAGATSAPKRTEQAPRSGQVRHPARDGNRTNRSPERSLEPAVVALPDETSVTPNESDGNPAPDIQGRPTAPEKVAESPVSAVSVSTQEGATATTNEGADAQPDESTPKGKRRGRPRRRGRGGRSRRSKS
jgi:cell fate regulator YaaT (PSP1 superfamily)